MRKIKQIERPFHIMRTMPGGERLFSAEASLDVAIARTDKLPKRQLPAYVVERYCGQWLRVYERNLAIDAAGAAQAKREGDGTHPNQMGPWI